MENRNNSFQRASARVMPESTAMEISVNNHREDDDLSYCVPYAVKIVDTLQIIMESIFKCSKLHWYIYFYSSSITSLVCLGLSLFLLYRYKDSDHLVHYIFQSIFAVLLGLNNGVSTYLISSSDEIQIRTMRSYIIANVLIRSIICLYALVYYDNYYYLFIILFFSAFTANVLILLVLIVHIICCLAVILAICELLIYPFKGLCYWLCTKNKSKVEVSYSAFYYEKNKTEATECVICLEEYKSMELICVAKCHASHIAHEKCMVNWLEVKKTCPICGKSAELC